jgi:hypothetical protein
MLIHIGGDTLVWLREVIGIFDAQAQKNPATAEFLQRVRNEGRMETVEQGEVKSFVLTDTKVYESPISPQTLRRRALYLEQTGRIEIAQDE